MIENVKRYSFNKSTNINLLRASKFKTNSIGFYFKRPLNTLEASKGALLTSLLCKTNKKYTSKQEFSNELNRLYGAMLTSEVTKHGEMITIDIRLFFPNDRFLTEEVFDSALDFLITSIYSPNINDGKFDSELFESEKQVLISEIQSRVVDKISYSYDKCIETMCAEESFGVYKYGDVETVESLSNEDLVEYYNTIVKNSELDITVVGDIDFDVIEQKLRKIDFPQNEYKMIDLGFKSFEKIEVKTVEVDKNLSQGKLNIGFRTNIDIKSPQYYALMLFSYILGGGTSSYLFKNVREKESLCYYIYSRLQPFKGLMLIGSGIEKDKYEKTKSMILEGFDKIKNGEFDEHDIELSKKSIVKALDSVNDSQSGIMTFYYNQILARDGYDLEKYKKNIMGVTKEEILEAGKNILLDSIYFLK